MAYGNGHIHLLKDIFYHLNKKNIISLHSKAEMLMPIKVMHAFYKSALTTKPIDLKTKPNRLNFTLTSATRSILTVGSSWLVLSSLLRPELGPVFLSFQRIPLRGLRHEV